MTYVNATDFNGNSSPSEYGKTYTVVSPMFQHQASGVDQIGVTTSLLSLKNDNNRPGQLLFLSLLYSNKQCWGIFILIYF